MIKLKTINNNNDNVCEINIDTLRKLNETDLNEIKLYCEEELIKGNMVSIRYKVTNNNKVIASSNILSCNINKVKETLNNIMDEINKIIKETKAA